MQLEMKIISLQLHKNESSIKQKHQCQNVICECFDWQFLTLMIFNHDEFLIL